MNCLRCNAGLISDVYVFNRPPGDDLLYMQDGLLSCPKCHHSPHEATMNELETRAQRVLDESAYAWRKYKRDTSVSEALTIPLRVWVPLSCDVPDGYNVDACCDMLAASLEPGEDTVSGKMLVRVPAQAVLLALPAWRHQQEENTKAWEARKCAGSEMRHGVWCKGCGFKCNPEFVLPYIRGEN